MISWLMSSIVLGDGDDDGDGDSDGKERSEELKDEVLAQRVGNLFSRVFIGLGVNTLFLPTSARKHEWALRAYYR